MLENEIDIMEVKLEKLESIFQKGLLPEDEYKQMRVKAIKESLENKTKASMILENQMDVIEAKLEKLKNMFERDLISKDEYDSIRKKIIEESQLIENEVSNTLTKVMLYEINLISSHN